MCDIQRKLNVVQKHYFLNIMDYCKRHRPTIYSLDAYALQITKDAFEILNNQYSLENHFEMILSRMKRPPGQTVLRLSRNNDTESRIDKIVSLRQKISDWLRELEADGLVEAIVKAPPVLDDVMTIDLEHSMSKTACEEVDVKSGNKNTKDLFSWTISHPHRYSTILTRKKLAFNASCCDCRPLVRGGCLARIQHFCAGYSGGRRGYLS